MDQFLSDREIREFEKEIQAVNPYRIYIVGIALSALATAWVLKETMLPDNKAAELPKAQAIVQAPRP